MNKKVEQMKNQLQEAPKANPIEVMIKKQVAHLGQALPAHMNAERLVRIALTTMRLNPDLYKCSPASILGALFQSAQLGLEPNVEGQAYIIPFKNNRKKPDGSWHSVTEAQFQIGYKGYVELFYRHDASVSLDMQKVHEHDDFDYNLGTAAFIKHKPALRDRGQVIAYYAVAKLKHGATLFHVMSKEECMEHGRVHSKCYSEKEGGFFKNTPWAKSPDAMCLKTVLIQLMKLLPKSIEVQRAIAADATVKTTIEPDMLEVKDESNWNDSPEDADFKPEGEPERQPEPKVFDERPPTKKMQELELTIEAAIQECETMDQLNAVVEAWRSKFMNGSDDLRPAQKVGLKELHAKKVEALKVKP